MPPGTNWEMFLVRFQPYAGYTDSRIFSIFEATHANGSAFFTIFCRVYPIGVLRRTSLEAATRSANTSLSW